MIFKLHDPAEIDVIQTFLERARREGKSVGLTSGSFDVFHNLHLEYLVRCERWCDILIVGVDSDEHVRATKGPGRPLIFDARRLAVIDNQKQVRFSCIMNSIEDFGLAAEQLTPDWIFRNDAFRGREGEILGKEHARQGIKIIHDVVDYSSTTAILRAAAKLAAEHAPAS